MYHDSSSNVMLAFSMIAALLGIAILVMFEFSPYAFILLSVLVIAALAIGVLAIAEDKTKDKEKRKHINNAMLGCYTGFSLLLIGLSIFGANKMCKAVERFSRDTTETTESSIISMGESTSFSGNIFCFGTSDYYIVMQETENGGYLKKKYPCNSTVLFETDSKPCAKTIKVYEEDVLVAKEGLFLPAGKEPGENIEYRRFIDVQYEIYIPKGTLQELPSMDMQFENVG